MLPVRALLPEVPVLEVLSDALLVSPSGDEAACAACAAQSGLRDEVPPIEPMLMGLSFLARREERATSYAAKIVPAQCERWQAGDQRKTR